ncbi:CYTH domain-containing protein [Endozoicomonas sp. Mp262]|uniref:CYTH domain-containing protein n=1 Tax=Endozoicomonas sp. Mp262 TaxID=2919499 RepID=UPI0021D8D0C1
MSQETELKLSVSEHDIAKLLTLSFWNQHAIERPDSFHLGNTYFDTPDRALNKARVALRVREKEGLYFQTLKTRGHSINGLSTRGEWEWPLTSRELDFSLLEALQLEALEGIAYDSLTPLFATDFRRTRWNLVWDEPYARIEAAFDRGHVQAKGRQSVICELELELLEGSEQALIRMAEQISRDVHLTPSDKSKAERGFELLNYTGK